MGAQLVPPADRQMESVAGCQTPDTAAQRKGLCFGHKQQSPGCLNSSALGADCLTHGCTEPKERRISDREPHTSSKILLWNGEEKKTNIQWLVKTSSVNAGEIPLG